MSVVSVCVECLEWLTCKVEEEDTTKHDSGPVTPTHHTQSGDCLFSAPGECWYSLGQTADLASTFRHCCQLGQNIQHTTKAFCVHFRFDKYFLSRARRRCGGRLDGLDADMRRWSEETRGSDLCPLSSEHLTEATLPLSRLIVHWKVSSDPPILPSRPEYVLLIAIFPENFPQSGPAIEHCATVAHHLVHHCLVTGCSCPERCVTLWQYGRVTQGGMWTECRQFTRAGAVWATFCWHWPRWLRCKCAPSLTPSPLNPISAAHNIANNGYTATLDIHYTQPL